MWQGNKQQQQNGHTRSSLAPLDAFANAQLHIYRVTRNVFSWGTPLHHQQTAVRFAAFKNQRQVQLWLVNVDLAAV